MSVRRLQLVESEEVDTVQPRLRVAIATQDMMGMNAHFGSARKFAIYDLGPGDSRLVEVVAFDTVSDETGSHKTEGDDRIGAKVAALSGCNLLFVMAIGGPAASRVVNARIHPVKLAAPEPIEAVLAKVQKLMIGNPPPWLRKAMGQAPARNMNYLDDEEDDR